MNFKSFYQRRPEKSKYKMRNQERKIESPNIFFLLLIFFYQGAYCEGILGNIKLVLWNFSFSLFLNIVKFKYNFKNLSL